MPLVVLARTFMQQSHGGDAKWYLVKGMGTHDTAPSAALLPLQLEAVNEGTARAVLSRGARPAADRVMASLVVKVRPVGCYSPRHRMPFKCPPSHRMPFN
jgi:hypothetical protein